MELERTYKVAGHELYKHHHFIVEDNYGGKHSVLIENNAEGKAKCECKWKSFGRASDCVHIRQSRAWLLDYNKG